MKLKILVLLCLIASCYLNGALCHFDQFNNSPGIKAIRTETRDNISRHRCDWWKFCVRPLRIKNNEHVNIDESEELFKIINSHRYFGLSFLKLYIFFLNSSLV